MALVLGIDLGTTKVAAAVAERETRETVGAVGVLHAAKVLGQPDEAEQNAGKILEAVDTVLSGLSLEQRERIEAIGVTGQMHGLILWQPGTWEHSPLITWEDQRCTRKGYLEELRKLSGATDIHAGYAGATLAWLLRNEPEAVEGYSCAGTIMDYLVARICGLSFAVIDPSNANSWGFFQLNAREWDLSCARRAGIPEKLLPEIRVSGSLAGRLDADLAKRWGLHKGLPVGVACGDNPAAIYASVSSPASDISINLGTGGQLAVILDSPEDMGESRADVDYRPFLDERVIAATTSLCGGKALIWLVDSVNRWLQELGLDQIPSEQLFSKLNDLGIKQSESSDLLFDPFFNGERHDPMLRGTIRGIDLQNFDLTNLSQALAAGMIRPLFERMPDEHLANRDRIVASGNGIRRSSLLQRTIEEVTGLPLIIPSLLEEAATGAALLAGDQLCREND